MLTLDNLLLESQAPASFVVGIARLAQCSLFAARLLTNNADLLEDLLQNHAKLYSIAEMQQFLSVAKIEDESGLKKALRQLRQRVILRIIYRDLNGLADLDEVMQTTTSLAEITLNTAVNFHKTWLQASYGEPFGKTAAQEFMVIGMGKLGGGELNVSSDIDLIFAYEEEGETNGEEPISNQDFFTKLAKKVISALDEITEDGFVFRVDMRLRPFGSEGVLVSNLDALEDYYQNNGREWERYAWVKGRVISNQNNDALGANIHALLRPFIFRKYLDFNALNSMRDLKLQIHRDVMQKAQHDNIKLGRGGIREIEFIAQVFQLIRGGRDADLQIKPTLQVLKLLKNKGLLQEKTVDELTEAYVFLRNLEHRLMYVDDAQTQDLPKSDEAKARIANAMNFVQDENKGWDALLLQLNAHRKIVAQHFDATFVASEISHNQTLISVWQNTLIEDDALQALSHAGYSDTKTSRQRLLSLLNSQKYKNLPESSRQRMDALMPLLIAEAGSQVNSDEALLRVINLLEAICRRASYLALLTEFPDALRLVIKLCAASPWLAQYLTAHPILLDELLDTQTLYAVPNFAKMAADLNEKMQILQGDAEAQMDAMRHFKHSAILRFAAQDLSSENGSSENGAGKLQLETLSDYLSDLADIVLQVSLPTIWKSLKLQHVEKPKFAVIGYGKLGGKELGYVSDLDIIFLYDDDAPDAAENYARFAQRINNWFNSLTNAGLLYETDLQLRPDGNSGLLVSSVEAFREYQLNKAWLWEHQAITRARFVAGDANIGDAFEKIRIEVLTQSRDAKKVKIEVIAMREKMRSAQTFVIGMFDIKHSVGGIVDVEFLVQCLVLLYANKYPQLTDNIGNISLLKVFGELKIIDKNDAKKVADAYREYRRMQHALKLQGAPNMRVEAASVSAHMTAVKALWQQVFAD